MQLALHELSSGNHNVAHTMLEDVEDDTYMGRVCQRVMAIIDDGRPTDALFMLSRELGRMNAELSDRRGAGSLK